MTDKEQQRKADHLALVAAPILVAMNIIDSEAFKAVTKMRIKAALDYAAALQKAAEERVKTNE